MKLAAFIIFDSFIY